MTIKHAQIESNKRLSCHSQTACCAASKSVAIRRHNIYALVVGKMAKFGENVGNNDEMAVRRLLMVCGLSNGRSCLRQ